MASVKRRAWGRRHRRHLDCWLGAWDLHPQILGGPAGPGGGASSRGRPGLRCRGAGIRVLGVRDEAGAEGGKGGCGRRPGVDGVRRTTVPCVHCPFPRVPFESGAAGNVRRKHPPPPGHSRHQSRWAQGGDGKETRRQHRQGCREQRGAGRGRGAVTGCPHHLLREREARPAGFPFLRFHIRLHPLLKKVSRKECKARRHLRPTGHAQRRPFRRLGRHTHQPGGGRGPRPGASPRLSSASGGQAGPPGGRSPSCGITPCDSGWRHLSPPPVGRPEPSPYPWPREAGGAGSCVYAVSPRPSRPTLKH